MDDLDKIEKRCRDILTARAHIPDAIRSVTGNSDDQEEETLRLITRLRAAEARIERVGAILSDEGCDCYCDCDAHHNADCDLCLACRIDREVSHG